jgi:hypothetical protein
MADLFQNDKSRGNRNDVSRLPVIFKKRTHLVKCVQPCAAVRIFFFLLISPTADEKVLVK